MPDRSHQCSRDTAPGCAAALVLASEAEQGEHLAAAVLKAFDGKERLQIRGKPSIDPAVTELCKVAGKQPPAIDR